MSDVEYVTCPRCGNSRSIKIPSETLRDRFAAAALTGLISTARRDFLGSQEFYVEAAKYAFALADAMLEQRAKEKT